MDFLRARRERRYALIINDPQPVGSVSDVWGWLARVSTVGMFVLALIAAVFFASPLLLPITAALIIGMTLGPLVKRAYRLGVSPWISGTLLVGGLISAAAIAVTMLAAPTIEWIGKAPEMVAIIKQRLYVLDWPLAALRELYETVMPAGGTSVRVETPQLSLLAPLIAAVTPAMAQLVIFAVTLLLFLVSQIELRQQLAMLFAGRDAKLRFLRIVNDIESNLESYVTIVTAINVGLGIVVAFGAWLFGLPHPLLFGALAMVLNFLPYIGPACTTVIILGVSLVTFPTLGYALLPPAAFIALATLEGQIITPTVLGHRLTLNPLLVFIAIVFWAWLWGPMGAFLAVPLSLVGLVILNHVMPSEEGKLPE